MGVNRTVLIGDCNFPISAGTGSDSPLPISVTGAKTLDTQYQATRCGSIVGIQDQTLGESVPITGTPYSLDY